MAAGPREIATTREMFAAWNESDVERMTDFWTEDGDWTWEDAPELPDARVVRGHDNVEAHLRDLTSGVRFVDDSFHLIRFEDGRVRRYRIFTRREQALAASEAGR